MLDSLVRVSRRVGRAANRFATDPMRFFQIRPRKRGLPLRERLDPQYTGGSWPHCLWQSVQALKLHVRAATPEDSAPPKKPTGFLAGRHNAGTPLPQRANVAPPVSAKAIPWLGGQWGQAPSTGAFPGPGAGRGALPPESAPGRGTLTCDSGGLSPVQRHLPQWSHGDRLNSRGRLCGPIRLQSIRFHVLLNSLFKVLFNFPSRYLFAIGLVLIFSLRWSIPPSLDCIPKQPDSGDSHEER